MWYGAQQWWCQMIECVLLLLAEMDSLYLPFPIPVDGWKWVRAPYLRKLACWDASWSCCVSHPKDVVWEHWYLCGKRVASPNTLKGRSLL